jgi:hypothetical protein
MKILTDLEFKGNVTTKNKIKTLTSVFSNDAKNVLTDKEYVDNLFESYISSATNEFVNHIEDQLESSTNSQNYQTKLSLDSVLTEPCFIFLIWRGFIKTYKQNSIGGFRIIVNDTTPIFVLDDISDGNVSSYSYIGSTDTGSLNVKLQWCSLKKNRTVSFKNASLTIFGFH